MSAEKKKTLCELCSQPVTIKGFELNTQGRTLKFCCEGCLSIYQLLNENELVTDYINPEKKR
ncbi:MAG: heavy metal translocating P-type ATPase metal-binding domain-containing protein [Gammaproteobacteria bacterium]